MSRGPYRSHSMQFKIQLCTDIRSGVIGRREAQRKYNISSNLIQRWLTQFDEGKLHTEEAEAVLISEYESQIAALERKVGQLTMEIDLLKKTPRHPTGNGSETLSIISGPVAAPSEGGAK